MMVHGPKSIVQANSPWSEAVRERTTLEAGSVKIERFEDIESWQIARKLTSAIYALSRNSSLGKDFGLRDQLQRAAVSIMANIAEGFDSRSDKEFVRFLNYAYRSATEVQSHLYVARDQEYLDKETLTGVYDQAATAKKLLSGFIRYLEEEK